MAFFFTNWQTNSLWQQYTVNYVYYAVAALKVGSSNVGSTSLSIGYFSAASKADSKFAALQGCYLLAIA